MVIVVQWDKCLPCGRLPGCFQHLPSSELLHQTLRAKSRTKHLKRWRDFIKAAKILLRQKENKRGTWWIWLRASILSTIAAGHQLAKSFLDQFVNSLSCKKDFGVHWDQQLMQFLVNSVRSPAHTQSAHVHTLTFSLSFKIFNCNI